MSKTNAESTSGSKDGVIFPFKNYARKCVHINPKTYNYLSEWKDKQSENLEHLYDDFYDLLNLTRTDKNYVLFTGPKKGVCRVRVIENFSSS